MMRNIAFAATDVASKVLNFSKRKLLEMLSMWLLTWTQIYWWASTDESQQCWIFRNKTAVRRCVQASQGSLIRCTVLDLLRVCSKVTWFCPS